MVVANKIYSSWTGHFSLGGFALGLLIAGPLYLWVAWSVVKGVNKESANGDYVAATTKKYKMRKLLILAGLGCLVLIPTLIAFASF